MSRFSFLFTVVAALAAMACTGTPIVDTAAEVDAVRQRQADWVAAENRRDLEATVSFLAADAIIQGEGAPVLRGRDGARELWSGIFAVPFTAIEHFQPRTVVVASSGDMAYDIGNFRVVLPSDTGTTEQRGKSTIVWQKTDGEWLAAAIAFSMDAPPTP
jgi:uncharacterized protein (TIGR02246 family)